MIPLRRAAVGLLIAALWLPAPARALDESVLNSVVRLKPDWPLGQRGVDASGAPRDPEGSGVAVLPGGYIATNVHVVGAATKVQVLTADGRRFDASVVGKDPATDIALLKIDADLPVLPLADRVPLAAPVCAIGNPFGLGLSVTCGVVSATRRAGIGFNDIEDFVQTDAAINPGGSGGALVDGAGRLVGLVSAIFTKRSDADIGVNFAASADLLMRVVEDLRDDGQISRADPGFTPADMPPADGTGVVVERVDPAGPAFAAGLDAGDVVLKIDGAPVVSGPRLKAMLYMLRPGAAPTLTVRRGDRVRDLRIALSKVP